MQQDQKFETILQLIIICFTGVFGLGIFFFTGHEWALGAGIGAFIAAIPIGIPFLRHYFREIRDIKGVEKVVLRTTGDIFDYLMPDLETSSSISVLGNTLHADVFSGPFYDALSRKKNDRELNLRICMYSPKVDNEFLQQRASDEVFDDMCRLELAMRGKSSPQEIDLEIDKLYKQSLKHMMDYLNSTARSIRILAKDDHLGDRLQVGLVDSTYILDSIIIAGDKVVVVDYLHRSGKGTPVIVMKGSPVSQAYRDEFERLWQLSQKVRNDNIEIGTDQGSLAKLLRSKRGGLQVVAMRHSDRIIDAILPELGTAGEVRLMGISLFRSLLSNDRFRQEIYKRSADGDFRLKVCILKDDTNNPSLVSRASEEAIGLWFEGKNGDHKSTSGDLEEIEKRKQSRIQHILRLISSSRDELTKIKHTLHGKVEVRFISKGHLLNSVMIVGNKTIVVDYLHQSGSMSPMFVFTDCEVARSYEGDFDKMWVLAEEAE